MAGLDWVQKVWSPTQASSQVRPLRVTNGVLRMTLDSLLQARQVSRLEVHAESRRQRKNRKSGSPDCLCLLGEGERRGGGLLPNHASTRSGCSRAALGSVGTQELGRKRFGITSPSGAVTPSPHPPTLCKGHVLPGTYKTLRASQA